MKYYVDRIEEGVAVMDNDLGEQIKVPLSRLPDGIRDGSVLERDENGIFTHNEDAEAQRRKEMSERLRRLKNRK